jgi:hypothetical protein
MPELFTRLVGLAEAVWSLFGPIGLLAAITGFAVHHLAEADLETPAGRGRVREALEAGGSLRQLYVRRITHGLNCIDCFLGDAGKAEFSLPSPFDNRRSWPYWTGWSFDRCARLALLYPLASLILIWAWSGSSGSIGAVLGLPSDLSWWWRAGAAMAGGR